MTENGLYWASRPHDDKRRDWKETTDSWVEDYVLSRGHPHRDLIIEALKNLMPFKSLLEVGCNAGPNIMKIREWFDLKDENITGIDINKDAIHRAKELMPDVHWKVADIRDIDIPAKIHDVVLVDAVLMYVAPENINLTMQTINLMARHGMILVEWDDESFGGVIKDHHWCRDYKARLVEMNFNVTKEKITNWPTPSWQRNGYIYTAVRA